MSITRLPRLAHSVVPQRPMNAPRLAMAPITAPLDAKAALRFTGVQSHIPTQRLHYINDLAPTNADGTVNAVVEIPAGTRAKMETDKQTGEFFQDRHKDGSLRDVDYLPYVANYGFVPQTYSDKASGGDGDAIDICVLSEAVDRGSVMRVKLLGGLDMRDHKERDIKLLAVAEGGPFKGIDSLEQLQAEYPGTVDIMKTWFKHYKKGRVNDIPALLNREEALQEIDIAHQAWRTSQPEAAARQPVNLLA